MIVLHQDEEWFRKKTLAKIKPLMEMHRVLNTVDKKGKDKEKRVVSIDELQKTLG